MARKTGGGSRGGGSKRGGRPTQRIVQPRKEGGYEVKAPKRAKQIVANEGGGEVRIKDDKGRIVDSDTVPPGRDPHPPKDTKH